MQADLRATLSANGILLSALRVNVVNKCFKLRPLKPHYHYDSLATWTNDGLMTGILTFAPRRICFFGVCEKT